MPRRPVLKCKSTRILCPDPTCRHVQRFGNSQEGKFRGRMLSSCGECGAEYFTHSADGGAEVIGLWPGESQRIDIDAPLPEIWKLLGLLEVA